MGALRNLIGNKYGLLTTIRRSDNIDGKVEGEGF